MGKKRKSAARPSHDRAPAPELAAEARVNRNLRSYEDVADSEDEFFLNRDRILLDEEPARKKRRQIEEEAALLEPSDEEVLAVPSSDSDGDDYESDDGNAAEDWTRDSRRERRAGDESDDSDEGEGDLAGWGSTKRDYYDGDLIETEMDAQEEEKEALRLQRKQLQGMRAADFGLDEAEWMQGHEDAEAPPGGETVVQEVLPELEISESMTEEERTQILLTRYPEFGPLSREFTTLQPVFEELERSATKAMKKHGDPLNFDDVLSPVLVKRNILASYLGSLAMYFAILTSSVENATGQVLAKSPAELREHPIMEMLVKTRQLWENTKDAKLPEPISDLKLQADQTPHPAQASPPIPTTSNGAVPKEKAQKKRSRKSKAQLEAEEALKEADMQRAARVKRVEADLAKLAAAAPSKQREAIATHPTSEPQSDSGSDFGEAEALTAEEADEKARRKRGLRFHTAKITQKSMKRDRATREGGDTDIPYRERLIDRQARLNAEAEARGARAPADGRVVLDAAESDDDDLQARAELRGADANGGEDEYYDLVAAKAQRKKAMKAEAAVSREAERIAARVDGDGELAPDGKRQITYAIEKNKGLTPKRKKEARNPRVKKRNRYEEKKKKLANLRPVYKGGEGRGGYGGELTGIRKNLVKSIKL